VLTSEIEKRLTTILGWGSLVVTLLVTDRISADPVNVSKMVALSVLAGACLPILFTIKIDLYRTFKFALIILSIYLIISLASILQSKSPLEKGFFGTYGRNTGLLTYIGLSIIFVSAMILKNQTSHIRMIRFLILAGFLNVLYCIIAVNVTDIFTWNNPYGKALGTFGNPNFISSFMGIFVTALFGLFFSKGISNVYRFIIFAQIVAGVYTILETGSQQGAVVAAGGMAIVLFFYLRAKFKNQLISGVYSLLVMTFSFVAVLGMLQIGPLAKFLYKQSVSLRGEYWQAGINMGLNNPIFGVGLDSYGTFYRTYRNESATVVPGVNTISDAAHNIFIDVFASTGIIGLLSYLLLLSLVIVQSIIHLKNFRQFDPIFVVLFSSWLAYQAQCVISINQIGIAVWGWLFGGLLIGYTRWVKVSKSEFQAINFSEFLHLTNYRKFKEVPAYIALGTFLSGLLFLAISMPSFYADAQLRNSIESGSNDAIYLAATRFPQDSNRMNFLASEISRNGINQQSVDLVKIGLEKFPNDYGLLFSQFQISGPSSPEYQEIGNRLHQADPYNPAYFEFR
jgi:O-antigen ligase